MQVKLVVTKEDEPSISNALTFSQEVITIGRDKTCDLWLDDPRKIIGRVHARVERTSRQVQLVDLGSKNFTFLKGKRIEAEKPRILETGDDFRIGDRLIIFEGLIEDQPAPEPIDVTIIDQKFPNPFMDEVQD
ncbi:FHA domain-containing protein, partial [candidate division KSB1 bacterium]|nr:FHA domain-containing protein [candidate division KSB1 bacterium]